MLFTFTPHAIECLKFVVEHGATLTLSFFNGRKIYELCEIWKRERIINECSYDQLFQDFLKEMEGNVECLKYLHDNGCPWNESSCIAAASEGNLGNLENLKYFHENGCPWNEQTSKAAVRIGDINCLKYLHENGCLWNLQTMRVAVEKGKIESVKYMHENGCEWDGS